MCGTFTRQESESLTLQDRIPASPHGQESDSSVRPSCCQFGVISNKVNESLLARARSMEIAGGLGPSAGKVWRIGIMGYNATDANVALVIAAFKDGLAQQNFVKK